MEQERGPMEQVRRSRLRYWLADGMEELLSGMNLVFVGVALYAMVHVLRGQLSAAWAIPPFLAFALLAVAGRRVRERIRRRVTYPRIGYMSTEPAEPVSRRRKLLIELIMAPVSLGPVVFIVLLLTDNVPDLATAARWGRWAPALFGVFVAASHWWDSVRSGFQRLRVTGVLVGGVGVAASLAAAHVVDALALFCIGWGVVNATSGAFTLRRFTATPPDGATP